MLLGDGDGKDADPHVAGLAELVGQCAGGGSGSDHVIDDEHVAVTDGCRIDELEGVFDVFKPLLCGQPCLALGECRAAGHMCQDGQTADFADALREHLTLVIAPLPQSDRCQRHGDERVDAVEKASPHHHPAGFLPQPKAHLGVVVVFQVKEQLATVVIHIIKQGGAPLEVSDLAIEPVRYQIVVRPFEKTRVRQFHQTR